MLHYLVKAYNLCCKHQINDLKSLYPLSGMWVAIEIKSRNAEKEVAPGGTEEIFGLCAFLGQSETYKIR